MALQNNPASESSQYPGSTSHICITATQSMQATFDPHWISVADTENTHRGTIDNSAEFT